MPPERSDIGPNAAQVIVAAVLADGAEFFLADLVAYLRRHNAETRPGGYEALRLIEDELAVRGEE